MIKISKILFFLILLVFPLGQLLNYSSNLLPGLRIQPLDILVFLFAVSFFLAKIFRREKIFWPLFFKEMAIFGSLAAFSLFINATRLSVREFLPSFFYLLRLWTYFLFYPALFNFLQKEKIKIASCLFWLGVAIAGLALAQYFLLPDTRFLFNFGWDDHYYRAIGSFLDPGYTGILLTLSFLALIVNFLERKEKPILERVLGGLLILAALGLSFSRISYLALALGLGAILFFYRKFGYFLTIILFFSLIVFLIPKPAGEGVNLWRLNSFWAKEVNYQQVWQIIRKNALWGVGYNAYRYAQHNYGFLDEANWETNHAGAGADNSFLFVWATCGLGGLAAFLYLWGKILQKSFQQIFQQKSALLVFVSILVLILTAMTLNCLFYPWIMVWFMFLLVQFTVDSEASTPA